MGSLALPQGALQGASKQKPQGHRPTASPLPPECPTWDCLLSDFILLNLQDLAPDSAWFTLCFALPTNTVLWVCVPSFHLSFFPTSAHEVILDKISNNNNYQVHIKTAKLNNCPMDSPPPCQSTLSASSSRAPEAIMLPLLPGYPSSRVPLETHFLIPLLV